jgi:hypothetical protein
MSPLPSPLLGVARRGPSLDQNAVSPLGRRSSEVGRPARADRTGFALACAVAVVDVGTTGVHPGYHHRVMEVAVVTIELDCPR